MFIINNNCNCNDNQVDGTKYIGQGKSKKLARIDAASSALRDFVQFKDQQIKNVMGINNYLSSNSIHSGIGGNLNHNLDFTSDEHIENTGILNSNCIKISDTLHNSILKNNQTNTLEEENLVKKIQQSLEILKSNTENQNIAWLNRLQSKYLFFRFRLRFVLSVHV